MRKFLLVSGDILLFYLSLFLTVLIGFWGQSEGRVFLEHLIPFSIVFPSWMVIFYISGLYDLHLIKTRFRLYSRMLGSLFFCFIISVIFFYLLPIFNISPKTNLLFNVLIFGALAFGWRKLFYLLFSSYFLNKVVIVGSNDKIQALSKEIADRPYLGYKVVYTSDGLDISDFLQKEKADTVIFTDDPNSKEQLLSTLYQCLPSRLTFLPLSKAYETICHKIPVDSIDVGWFLENIKEGEKIFYDKIKRGLDFFLAIAILIFTSPLIPFIALAIKLEDGGPIFYQQERVGKDRHTFKLLKFRSMHMNAEKEGPVWAEKEDPRVTKVGRFLRNTHLDELPQMINVIKGDISLVGPRPERPEFVSLLEKEIPHYHLRHLIKPGFTGWAQLKFRYGRSILDSQEKFQYDLYYLKNRSLILDLGILLKTFQLFFKKDS